jgi:hypothetical protein
MGKFGATVAGGGEGEKDGKKGRGTEGKVAGE